MSWNFIFYDKEFLNDINKNNYSEESDDNED
jgi:hypothetical protein